VQRTIRHSVELEGTGLHSGARTRLRIEPAAPHHGLVFRRSDITDGRSPLIAARYSNVDETTLHTRICNDDGVKIATVEHVLAAIAGCGIHNAVIEVDGPEVPIFDGSSRDIVQALLNAGIETQSAPLQALQIQREVAVSIGEATARLVPADGFFIDASIEFDEAAIGRQSRSLDMANGAFLRELSDCRTFCRQGDVDAMRAQGLALGGSYYNAVVVDGDRVGRFGLGGSANSGPLHWPPSRPRAFKCFAAQSVCHAFCGGGCYPRCRSS